MTQEQLLNSLECPEKEDRLVPFWFWNGDLNETEIDRQIDEMAAKGIGGIAISPRQGMSIPYLSKRYFELFRHAALKAWDRGMFTWIYDEYPYPSGISGGEVMMRMPESRQTKLKHVTRLYQGGPITWPLDEGVVMDIKAVPLDEEGKPDWANALDLMEQVGIVPQEKVFQLDSGLTCYNQKRFFTHGPQETLYTDLPEGNWRLDACVQVPIRDFKYYGGFIDPCDPDATALFLQTTHERYAAAMGDLFGTVITGVFTDETGLLGGLPWSRKLPEAYKLQYGEAINDKLCRMLDADAADAPELRQRFYRTMHQLLRENYHGPVSRWCKAHHLAYIAEVPGMRMTTQLYSTVVGGDFNHEKIGVPLDEIHDLHTANYRHNPTAIASLAQQNGADRALVESFHSIGWSMTLQDARWGIDYLTACGINQFNLHAFYYAADGLRKYDAPASQFLQNPYWAHYRLFADYAARSARINRFTQSMNRIAILEPTTALWCLLTNPFDDYACLSRNPKERERHNQIQSRWFQLRRSLFHAQIGFDHLDPEMLIRGKAEDGRLQVGRASYTVIIVTECSNLEAEARSMLTQFAAQGGLVLQVQDEQHEKATWPVLSIEDEEIMKQLLLSRVPRPLYPELKREDSYSCVSGLRITEDGVPWLFISNQEGRTVQGKICLSASIRGLMRLNAVMGESNRCKILEEHCCNFELAPYEGAWFFGCQAEETAPHEGERRQTEGEVPAALWLKMDEQPLCYALEGENLLRLENAQARFDGGDWFACPVRPYSLLRELDAGIAIKDLQWTDGFGLPKHLQLRYPVMYELRFHFQVEIVPEQLRLVIEKDNLPEQFEIHLNGHALPQAGTEANCWVWQVDNLTKEGENELYFHLTVLHDWEGLTDAIHLRGSFSLKKAENGWRIVPVCSRSSFSTHYPEGAPFYSGQIHWQIPFALSVAPAKACVKLQTLQPLMDCLSLEINGKPLGTCAFTPYEWRADDCLREGENSAVLTVTNTLIHAWEGEVFNELQHQLISL